MTKPYFDAPLPHRIAHRGSTLGGTLDENSWAAFRAAIRLGATHIETDAQGTSDGHAVLVHDDDLVRIGAAPLSGGRIKVAEYELAELQAMRLAHGGAIPSLAATLAEFPQARFNIDVKRPGAITAVADAINRAKAWDRVLVTSFSDSRRLATLALLSDARTATSAGAGRMLGVLIAALVGRVLPRGLRVALVGWALLGLDALQIPIRIARIRVDRAWFISAVRAAGVQLQFWVINSRTEAERLVALGATGIMSDDLESTL